MKTAQAILQIITLSSIFVDVSAFFPLQGNLIISCFCMQRLHDDNPHPFNLFQLKVSLFKTYSSNQLPSPS